MAKLTGHAQDVFLRFELRVLAGQPNSRVLDLVEGTRVDGPVLLIEVLFPCCAA